MAIFSTIEAPSTGLYKEKGSKFLSFAFPISELAEINDHIEDLKRKFHDARHHCFAYILGMEQQEIRAYDDGEPTHSAGDPILGQIRSFGLTNVLVVVVRYFGGTKLGVGGLVNAYKLAAGESLSKATIVAIYPTKSFSLSFPYTQTSDVERLLNEHQIEFTEKKYTEICYYEGNIPTEEANLFEEKLSRLQGVELKLD